MQSTGSCFSCKAELWVLIAWAAGDVPKPSPHTRTLRRLPCAPFAFFPSSPLASAAPAMPFPPSAPSPPGPEGGLTGSVIVWHSHEENGTSPLSITYTAVFDTGNNSTLTSQFSLGALQRGADVVTGDMVRVCMRVSTCVFVRQSETRAHPPVQGRVCGRYM